MNSTATRAIPGSHSLSGGRDLKKQLLTKVEKSRYNIPRTLTLYLNCFSALGCAREQTTTEVCPHEGLLMFKETSSGVKSVTGYGQQWCMESQPKLKRSPGCVCGHSTISSGHLLPVKNQSFGEWQFRVFESKLQYFSRSAES